MSKQPVLLPEAIAWLTVWSETRVLTVDGRPQFAHRLRDSGHNVFAVTPDEGVAAQLRDEPGITPICSRPEAIGCDPCQFDVVATHERFHVLDHSRALSEIARVLRPGGCLSASYVIRDDSVPWVRRLAALLRRFDPLAMRGDYGQHSLAALEGSKYFPEVERRAFRVWQPVSLADLQDLVARQPLSRNLSPEQARRLQSEVDSLFSSSVRPGEMLRLPYQLLCVRAWVSHDELTATTHLPDAGVRISL